VARGPPTGTGAAFFTARIALAGGVGAEGVEEGGSGRAGAGAPTFTPTFTPISDRIREASSSLIELLWLLAAMESFSAASSTSLLSRPRSLDSS
jgi:hypothetical protein